MRFVLAALFAGLVGLLIATPTANADGCRFARGSNYQSYGYHANFVNYNYGYHDTVLVPYAVPVTIVPYTYFAVAPELAYARINQELADQAARKAVAELLKGQGAPSDSTPAASPPAPPTPPSPSSNPQTGNPSGDQVLSKVKAHVQNSCIKCHGKDNDFSLADVESLSREKRLEVVYRIMTDDPKIKMPKTGTPATAEELNAWHAFVNRAPKAAATK